MNVAEHQAVESQIVVADVAAPLFAQYSLAVNVVVLLFAVMIASWPYKETE
ncbi:MAG: hypothetical protein AAF821_07475 [Cyanobacteria bacterium P01_D01_bin.156]